MAGKRFRVLYNFTAAGPAELSCSAGDDVVANGEENGGWINVTLVAGANAAGRIASGLVPFSYLKEIKAVIRPAPAPPSTIARQSSRSEKCYKVLYNFVASNQDELTCSPGELVVALGSETQGWIKVKKVNNDASGLVPFSYISELPNQSTSTPSSPQRLPQKTTEPPPTPVAQMNVAVEHAECAICYDEMASKPVAILLNSSRKRPCRHFLHKECAEGLLRVNQKTCPICRAAFVSLYPLPSFDSNPKLWFECVDANGDGTLSKAEVIEVLKATMAIDYRAFEKNVDALWPRWDKDGSGEIDFSELCDPKIGLLVYVRSHFARKKREPPPKLTLSNLEVWYQYWDEDDNGSLNKEEIIRALVKTFRLSTTPSKIRELRESVEMVWTIFDADNSGEVELKEFVSRDGLGESLCASLTFSQ